MIVVAHFQSRQRPLPLGVVALQTAHPLPHLGQPLAPIAPLEEIPERVRVEYPDIPAMTGHLDRLMPHRGIKDRRYGIYEGPTHGWTNENSSGTFAQSRIESEMKDGRASKELSRLQYRGP